MKLKRYSNFITESVQSDAEDFLLNLGFEQVNGRWNGPIDTSFDINDFAAKKLIINNNLIVKFGIIDGNFHVNKRLKNESIERLPTYVKGTLNISNNHFSNMKDFHTIVDEGINLSHNHLHKLENIQEFKDKNAYFDVSYNMLTTLEGCPKEVGAFRCTDNWLNSAYGAPNKINENKTVLDEKIPEIEREFYMKKSQDPGIVNYHTELLQYIYERFKDDDVKINDAIMKIKWPKGTDFDQLKSSVTAISKFKL